MADQDSESLPQLFNRAEIQMEKLEDSERSPESISALIKQFETATKFVSILGLFSRNESADEISTADLRYLLLPAYLARLTLKLTDGRKARLDAAEIYIVDYLQRCKDYGVPGSNAIPDKDLKISIQENGSSDTDAVQTSTVKSPQDQIAEAVNKRAAKIAAFKHKLESKEKAAALRKKLEDGSADENEQRGYYYNLFNMWILDLMEELDFVREEKRLLEHREKLSRGASEDEQQPVQSPMSKTLSKFNKPVTIVKNELQKQVFGAGYPSLPLLTVDEFYQELVQEGALPAPGSKAAKNLNYMGPTQAELESDDVKKEQDVESDNPEYLRNARDYDDWKDDHRRGWGNRIGQG
ncbi:immunoglobulin-binding protein 1-like [Paramacrobiotus metropolitanus]|uniref:immunoglobulin-binding protein 1-like n=1 Tax=Paramacrobiotus metropolitanus TaxID=2943436 RepID=UPI00244593F7|nr:immunoglobulin-binding protein 1-like [Paramacrobiotus metropolitanus]